MKIINCILIAATCILPMLSFAGNSEQATKDRMKADLDIIRNFFDVGYAPKEWKNTYCGWELDHEIQQAKDRIQNCNGITVKKYQEIVSSFFHSTKDYHVTALFYSTETASLPFTVIPAEGKYYISHIEESKLNSLVYPMNVGDELVFFDDKPVTDAIDELMQSITRQANEATDRTFASYFLTHRLGRLGHKAPKGSLMIGVKSPFSSAVKKMQLMWTHQPEKISNGFTSSLNDEKASRMSIFTPRKFGDKMMVIPEYEFLRKFIADERCDNEFSMGARKSYVPTLGVRLWWVSPSNSHFHAYIYETFRSQANRLCSYSRLRWRHRPGSRVCQLNEIVSRTD